MQNKKLYPWQHNDYANLIQSFRSRRFNALILSGANNSGRELLVNELIQYMLCLNPLSNLACNKCAACVLFKAGNHPDYRILTSEDYLEKKNAQIKVEQIRELAELLNRSAHVSKIKIVDLPRLSELDLNLNSANALLKILEEPPSECFFILQTNNLSRVLATIKSRCFKYQLQLPTKEQALEYVKAKTHQEFWLSYFNYEPLFTPIMSDTQLEVLIACLESPSVENILLVIKDLEPKKLSIGLVLDFIIKWLMDLMSLAQANKLSYFMPWHDGLIKLIPRLNQDKLFKLQNDLLFLQEWSEHPLNQKLQLENILFKYQQLYT